MMRFAIVALLLIAMTQTAPAAIGFGGGVHGGISISSFPKEEGASESFYGLGYGFGAHGDLNIIKYFTARLNFDYHIFPSDKEKMKKFIADINSVAQSDLSLEGWNISIIGITANGIGKLPLSGPVSPYALAGLGMHIVSISDPKLTYQGEDVTSQVFEKAETKTKFGINFGAGAEFKLATVKLYLEVKYVLIFTENKNSSHIPITVGVTF